MSRCDGECPTCGQPLPEPYRRPAAPPAVDPLVAEVGALLKEWNRQVANGLPTHDPSVARDWLEPVLPALKARTKPGQRAARFGELLTAWLAEKGGKRPVLRFFCADLPDLLNDVVAEQPGRVARLFPLVKAEPDTTEYLPPDEIAALARGIVEARRVKP